jgi:two-component system, OmpR family, phosphate regulon response regulator PhoB
MSAKPTRTPSSSANGTAKPLILIVEDEVDLVTLLQYNLEKEGFRTINATDGEEALLLAQEQRPSLMLLDWMLPVLSGIEVCRQLRRNTESLFD